MFKYKYKVLNKNNKTEQNNYKKHEFPDHPITQDDYMFKCLKILSSIIPFV